VDVPVEVPRLGYRLQDAGEPVQIVVVQALGEGGFVSLGDRSELSEELLALRSEWNSWLRRSVLLRRRSIRWSDSMRSRTARIRLGPTPICSLAAF
jgi:hypothetical protein